LTFIEQYTPPVRAAFAQAIAGLPVTYEPRVDFKKRVPVAIGLLRTADIIQDANIILMSA
jgi:D-ribose pyranase